MGHLAETVKMLGREVPGWNARSQRSVSGSVFQIRNTSTRALGDRGDIAVIWQWGAQAS